MIFLRITRINTYIWMIWRKNFKTQCGKYIIFLSLRFSVKPISVLHFLKAEIYQNQKFKAPEMEKIAFFELLHSPKLISRKIWVSKNADIFHTVKAKMPKMLTSHNLCDSICDTSIAYSTVWKIQHFSVTQILREINFKECESLKKC